MTKPKILLGMSGGIDSTYSAVKLLKMGYDVEGAILIMSEHTDAREAAAVAESLGIPFHTVDCRDDFENFVKKPFTEEYCAGRTPNPCVICNRYVKIARLCALAREIGAEKVATGHYLGIEKDETTGRFYPRAGADEKKDQSYVFWNLTQDELSMLCTPLAEAFKQETVAKAKEEGLPVPEGESQDICFLPDGDHAAFIESRVGRSDEGNFVSEDGTVLGRHKGIIHYTVGQRKGLGIALGHPAFVLSIDAGSNTVCLGEEKSLFRDSFSCSRLNFCKLPPKESGEIRADVRIRYSKQTCPCTVSFSENRAKVRLDKPVRAVTPGQSAVFYENGGVLFGGFIDF